MHWTGLARAGTRSGSDLCIWINFPQSWRGISSVPIMVIIRPGIFFWGGGYFGIRERNKIDQREKVAVERRRDLFYSSFIYYYFFISSLSVCVCVCLLCYQKVTLYSLSLYLAKHVKKPVCLSVCLSVFM